jgi:hypothetical protein
MTAVHYDAQLTDRERRERLYAGDLFVYAPTRESLAFVAFARKMLAEAFAPLDPEVAQHELPVAEFARLLGEFKPRFIHHPECKQMVPGLLAAFGCDLDQTYFDVPRIRTATSNDYLTTGIAYAFHPHRDTWYSAPMCQINWWMPVYSITHDNCMAFHPRYWDTPVRNSSSIYNYQEWNKHNRFNAAQQVGKDERPQPKALEPVEVKPDLRLVPPVGGVIVFSGAQLHSSVPNSSGRTRFSIDFRTVHLHDVTERSGAPNTDSHCTGTTMADYLRCTDLAHLPGDATAPYQSGPPPCVPKPTQT